LITRLNAQHGAGRFYLLHRKREWNPSERRWMGWERKRGKLHEFNRLLGEPGARALSCRLAISGGCRRCGL
jgi:hypothetical protein